MTLYIIEMQDKDGDWVGIGQDYATPTTMPQAADTLIAAQDEFYDTLDWRVTLLQDNGKWADATFAVTRYIKQREREAAEDEAHERQERHGFEQV